MLKFMFKNGHLNNTRPFAQPALHSAFGVAMDVLLVWEQIVRV